MTEQPPNSPPEAPRRVPVGKQRNVPLPSPENRAGCLILGAVLGIVAGAILTIFVLPRLLA